MRYATFLGGSDWDYGYGIAVDGAGQAYVTGYTGSADFPASLGPGYDTSYNGGYATPSSSSWTRPAPPCATPPSSAAATVTTAGGIAVDGAGQAYVTGCTGSADFPASLGPGYDTSYNGGSDAFVVKLDAAGTGLRYATFLGGSNGDYGYGIAVDGAGQAYVTGRTGSADFPASLGPGYDTSFNGGWSDAFVVKLDAAGTGLRYATFLGGSDGDYGFGIAVDGAGQAYVTGATARRTSRPASAPATTPATTAASTMPSSSSWTRPAPPCATPPSSAAATGDEGFGIAVDGAGQAYVTGYHQLGGLPGQPRPRLRHQLQRRRYEATPSSSSWTRPAPPCATPPSSAAATVTTGSASPWTAPARPTSRAVPGRRTSRPASAPATTPASTAATPTPSSSSWTRPVPPCWSGCR